MNLTSQAHGVFRYGVIAILLTFACVTDSQASSVFAFSNNQGSYSIQANNLNKMTSAEIRISYQVNDQSEKAQVTLYPNTNYTITQSSGPGYLDFKLAYIEKVYPKGNKTGIPNPMQRLSGDYKLLAIAKIPGDVTALSATICSDKAGCESLQGTVTNSTNSKKDDKKDQADKTENPDRNTPTADTGGIRSTAYPDPAIQNGTPPSPDRSSVPQDGGAGMKTSGDKSAGGDAEHPAGADDLSLPIIFSRREGLLERFIALTGGRSLSALVGLLQSGGSDATQDPPLLVSDGNVALILTVRVSGKSTHAPQFFISGGHCTSLKPAGNGTWIVEIIPDRGVMKASVIVLSGREAIEYPLAVAPPRSLFDTAGASADQNEFVRIVNELVCDDALM
jgi:hypothetical protein